VFDLVKFHILWLLMLSLIYFWKRVYPLLEYVSLFSNGKNGQIQPLFSLYPRRAFIYD
jgi:hypothetical protein